MEYSQLITWFISIAALSFSIYNFYVNRKDKKPKLRISLEMTDTDVPAGKDDFGDTYSEKADAIVIHAANPTERQINVSSIEYEEKGLEPFVVPLSRVITAIPPHEKRHAIIVAKQFYDEL